MGHLLTQMMVFLHVHVTNCKQLTEQCLLTSLSWFAAEIQGAPAQQKMNWKWDDAVGGEMRSNITSVVLL